MSGGTTVRELLDLAVEQLDSLSRDLTSASGPAAADIADAWPGFAAASRQLLRVSVAFHNPRDKVQREAAAAASSGQCGPSTGAGEPRLARAADLVGAAADLIEPQARMVAAADRRAACIDAARVYLLGAQVTVHATMPHLGRMETAAAAALAARDAARVIRGGSNLPIDGGLSYVATSRRPQPGAGDLLGLFDLAVFDWRRAALDAARRPDVSSEDLRGAALGAGRIVALTQVLHRAHWQSHMTEAEGRQADLELTRVGRGLAAVATGWTPFATGTTASPELVRASSMLQQAISLLACEGPHWLHPEQLACRAEPALTPHSTRAALHEVGSVVQLHSDATRVMVHHDRLFRRLAQSDQPAQPINTLRSARWVPASAWDTAELIRAYERATTVADVRCASTLVPRLSAAVVVVAPSVARADPASARRR